MPIVNLITQDNGGGLSQDTCVMSSALREAGASVITTDVIKKPTGSGAQWQPRSRHTERADVNVMIEIIVPELLDDAATNVYVPNPEHLDLFAWGMLCRFDAIWTKTKQSTAIFDAVGLPTNYIGFSSVDRRLESISPRREFLHLSSSFLKGTSQLIDLWRQHPEWPQLTVVYNDHFRPNHNHQSDNIRLLPRIPGYAHRKLVDLQNTCKFHLCPSETEGWGHCLVEALSTESIVLTLNAPPMNELVSSERGVMVDTDGFRQIQGMAMRYHFETRSMTNAVNWCLAASDQNLDLIGQNARAWFVQNDVNFRSQTARALHSL